MKSFGTITGRHRIEAASLSDAERRVASCVAVDSVGPRNWVDPTGTGTRYYCPRCFNQSIIRVGCVADPRSDIVIKFDGYSCNTCSLKLTKQDAGTVMFPLSIKLYKFDEDSFQRGYQSGLDDAEILKEEEWFEQYAEEMNSGILDDRGGYL